MGFSKYWEALKGTVVLLRIMCVWKNHMLKGLNLCSLEYLSISDIKNTEKQSAPNSDVQIDPYDWCLVASTVDFFWKLYKRYALMRTQAYKHTNTHAHICIHVYTC